MSQDRVDRNAPPSSLPPTQERAGDGADTRSQDHQDHQDREDRQVRRIVRAGPGGAFAVAGIATAIVVLIYLGFYLFVYLPRGAVQ